MFGNAPIYVARFVGDLVSFRIGVLSIVPLAYWYFKNTPAWLTADFVRWGALALGSVLASYRLWLRAGRSRTSDAFDVLVVKAAMS